VVHHQAYSPVQYCTTYRSTGRWMLHTNATPPGSSSHPSPSRQTKQNEALKSTVPAFLSLSLFTTPRAVPLSCISPWAGKEVFGVLRSSSNPMPGTWLTSAAHQQTHLHEERGGCTVSDESCMTSSSHNINRISSIKQRYEFIGRRRGGHRRAGGRIIVHAKTPPQDRKERRKNWCYRINSLQIILSALYRHSRC
jgi:hypothetical protein